ncbi:MAG TPA: ABC transporter substrate-binding protein [Acidimicrobiales bacterium]|nr:ABC transporter substrate-binding protein [Acidimicrobiales bacterium]
MHELAYGCRRGRVEGGRRARVAAMPAVAGVLALGAAALLAAPLSAGASSPRRAPSSSSGGTLTLQFTAPVSLNPALEGIAESDIDFGALDYDSLFFQQPDGSYTGDLVTSWSYVPGTHNEKFDMTVRPGVRFSDGSAVTAEAIVKSLQYFASAHGPQSAFLASMTSATASGSTVHLGFSSPAPDLPFLFDQYEGVGQIIGPAGIANPTELQTTSDGAGPFVLSASQSVAGSEYVFTRNPHYWNPSAVHYSKVIVKVIADPQSALSALESGQVDVLTSVPWQVAKPALASGYTVYEAPFSIASLFLMDRSGTTSPLGSLDVRQAIEDAIERPALAHDLGGPRAVATDEVSIPGATGYDPKLAGYYSYDLTKAKQLLAAGGYANGFTMDVLDTVALDPNGDLGAALKVELAQIGITLDLTDVPSPAQFLPAALSKQYPALIWPISQDGNGFAYSVEFALVPFTNVFGSTSATLTALLTAATGAGSTAAADSDYQKVNDWLVRNAWYVPVYSLNSTYVIGKDVANVSPINPSNTTIDPVDPTEPSLSWHPSK